MELNHSVTTFLAFCVYFVTGNTNEICNMDKPTGDCGSSMGRYYFNKETKKCEQFTYTGCNDGNDNNFAFLWECERTCPGDLELGDVCSLEPEPGIPETNIMCMAYMPRYYFNNASGECEKFIFGGCGGNHNHFYTKEDCESYCPPVPQPPFDRADCYQSFDSGTCRAHTRRFYYDKEAGKCKGFTYGGCGGNRNNFKTREECYNKCGDPSATYERPDCDKAPEAGTCGDSITRYYYSQDHGCATFVYSGCDGNRNNFETQAECYDECGDYEI